MVISHETMPVYQVTEPSMDNANMFIFPLINKYKIKVIYLLYFKEREYIFDKHKLKMGVWI